MNSNVGIPVVVVAMIDRLRNDGFAVSVDPPRLDSGHHWIDITKSGFRTAVCWAPERGFGVYLSLESYYGEKPDHFVDDPVPFIDSLYSSWLRR